MAFNPIDEISACARIRAESGEELDISGFEKITCRLQHGAADEFTIELPAQDVEGNWRADMPVWQVGSSISVEVGYNGRLDRLQTFEVVSTTVKYPNDNSGETMTVRGVSALARAARNKASMVWVAGTTFKSALDILCNDYGWTNGVDDDGEGGAYLSMTLEEAGGSADFRFSAKPAGESDLTYLKRISSFMRLGGPRVDRDGRLTMPVPTVGGMTFVRGVCGDPDARRLHDLSMERDGGGSTRLRVTAWDPQINNFVDKEFEADEFGLTPEMVFSYVSTVPMEKDPSTMGVTLAVIERRGYGKDESVDVISSARYHTDLSAEELAARYFELREKLGRWAKINMDGHTDIVPYRSFNIAGNLAAVDRGIWLPIWVEHEISSNGWTCECNVVRVVENPPPISSTS